MGSPNVAVPAEPVRRRLRWLMDAGMGVTRIATVSGVPRATLSCILYGIPSRNVAPWATVSRNHAHAIALLRPDLADGRVVDATGTRRRLQGLVARGWSMRYLARRLGMERSHFGALLAGKRQCQEATRRAACGLYEQMWDVDPPCGTRAERTAMSKSMLLAARRGWAPPMAWDDDELDDPKAKPFGVRTVDDVRRQLTAVRRRTTNARLAA